MRRKHYSSAVARIDYVSGGKRPLVCFFSNDLNIHRTKTEKANDLWRNQLGDLLTPPEIHKILILMR